jgi:hypothetical protein
MSAAIHRSRSGDWRKGIGLAILLIPIGLLLLLGIGELAGGRSADSYTSCGSCRWSSSLSSPGSVRASAAAS